MVAHLRLSYTENDCPNDIVVCVWKLKTVETRDWFVQLEILYWRQHLSKAESQKSFDSSSEDLHRVDTTLINAFLTFAAN